MLLFFTIEQQPVRLFFPSSPDVFVNAEPIPYATHGKLEMMIIQYIIGAIMRRKRAQNLDMMGMDKKDDRDEKKRISAPK